MRRLLTFVAVLALLASACSDDDGGFGIGDGTTEATTEVTEGGDTSAGGGTTDTTKPRDVQAAGAEISRLAKKDPGDTKMETLAKAPGTDRDADADDRLDQTGTVDPQNRGDDPYMDGLWDDCAAGDMAACDELFQVSPIDSEYERFGDTCGNRTDGGVWCTDLETDTGPFTYGDDPDLDRLWDFCSLGGWSKCDLLYVEAPSGSEYEDFGYTCGDTTDGSEWCVDAYPAEDDQLQDLADRCEAGDWASCDTLYVEAPAGSDLEAFGFTCGNLTDGSRWCVDEFDTAAGTYGSDRYLDGLWDDCEAGDMTACDNLYLESPVDSEYEQFGYTCGNRSDGSEWCVDTLPGDAFGYGDDPDLDYLWDLCAAGDWQACDDLYSQSPFGSEYEDYGGTCGNTTDGTEWCTDVYDSTGPFTYGDDPALDAMWDDCAAGVWQACDDLYNAAPLGSEYEEYGGTCAYTTDGWDWCVDVYDGGGNTAGDPYTYGDDPYFDGLWDDCAAGVWQACDDLYSESPFGSEYEDYGGTCGWTTDGTEYCVDVYGNGTGDPFTYGDDAYLDGLWDDCTAGNWQACDDLYLASAVGSEYEQFGFTCGNQTDGTGWCVDVFGGGDDNEPFTYGDDAYLDGLWDDCTVGNWQACDDLFSESPFGSDYETYGGTCAGTTDGTEYCVDVYGTQPGGDPFTYGDDAYLDGLWDLCAGGDWQGCDDLYLESPIDSEYEAYGDTCGYLTDGTEWCVDAMA